MVERENSGSAGAEHSMARTTPAEAWGPEDNG